jgi:tetratricopeptide (TPR) repeat protein
MGDYRGAQADLLAAVKLNEGLKEKLKGTRYADLGAVFPAMEVKKPAVDPEALKLKEKGNGLMAKKDYAGAIAAYTAAIEVDANYADALNNRGLAEMETDAKGDALVDFDRAVALNPWDARYLGNRSELYSRWGRKFRALADAEAAVEVMRMGPKEGWSRGRLVQLGLYAVEARQFENGLAALEEANGMESLEGYATLAMGLCCAAKGEEGKAMEWVRAGLAKKDGVEAAKAILPAVQAQVRWAKEAMDAGVMVVVQHHAAAEMEVALERAVKGK